MTEQMKQRAYLLGELSEEDRVELEQDYLADDVAFERLLAVEDELAYDYLEGRLSPDQKRTFENTIAATERGRGNLEFARELLAALNLSQSARRPSRSYWAVGLAAAAALAILPVWLAFQVAGLTRQLEKAQAPAQIGSKAVEPVEVAFLLTPGQSRGADGPPTLELSAQAAALRFELVPPAGSAGGDLVAVARTSEGNQIWSQSVMLAGRTWIVRIPASVFASGTYELALRRLTAGEQSPELAVYRFNLKHN